MSTKSMKREIANKLRKEYVTEETYNTFFKFALCLHTMLSILAIFLLSMKYSLWFLYMLAVPIFVIAYSTSCVIDHQWYVEKRIDRFFKTCKFYKVKKRRKRQEWFRKLIEGRL